MQETRTDQVDKQDHVGSALLDLDFLLKRLGQNFAFRARVAELTSLQVLGLEDRRRLRSAVIGGLTESKREIAERLASEIYAAYVDYHLGDGYRRLLRDRFRRRVENILFERIRSRFSSENIFILFMTICFWLLGVLFLPLVITNVAIIYAFKLFRGWRFLLWRRFRKAELVAGGMSNNAAERAIGGVLTLASRATGKAAVDGRVAFLVMKEERIFRYWFEYWKQGQVTTDQE